MNLRVYGHLPRDFFVINIEFKNIANVNTKNKNYLEIIIILS
jgi:hypothetical protein